MHLSMANEASGQNTKHDWWNSLGLGLCVLVAIDCFGALCVSGIARCGSLGRWWADRFFVASWDPLWDMLRMIFGLAIPATVFWLLAYLFVTMTRGCKRS